MCSRSQKLLCNNTEVMKIAVLNSKGKETGREVTLPKEIFSIEPNEHALY